MIFVTTVTITATNVAQAVQAAHQACAWVTLQADPSNSSTVYHGPPAVTSSTGQAIASGGGGGSPQYPPLGVANPYDLARVYIIGTQNDIVRVMYGVA